jgi:hypothetical protein
MTALSMLEDSNTKIDVLVTEQGELQSRNTLELQLVDSTNMSRRCELEAGTSTIAELTTKRFLTPGATSDSISMADDDGEDTDDDDVGGEDTDDDDGGSDGEDDDDDDFAPLVGRESSVVRPGVIPTRVVPTCPSYRHRECIDASWKAAAPKRKERGAAR